MKSQVIKLLVIVLSINCVLSDDSCNRLMPNGSFEGIGLYHWRDISKGSPSADRLMMWNRVSQKEWEINLRNNTLVLANVETTCCANVLNKFVVNSNDGKPYECETRYQNGKSGPIKTECRNDASSVVDEDNQYNPNAIIFNRNVTEQFVIVLGKYSRSLHYYNPINKNLVDMSAKLNDTNLIPQFVAQFDRILLTQIDGIAALLKDKGHLILFNINGKPKYCINNGTALSDNCKRDKLRTYAEECSLTLRAPETIVYTRIWLGIGIGTCTTITVAILGFSFYKYIIKDNDNLMFP